MGRDAGTVTLILLFYLAVTLLSTAMISVQFPTFVAPLAPTNEAVIPGVIILCFLPLFLLAEFSFGYLVSLSAYGMIAAFIAMSYSTTLRQYDHAAARLSMLGALLTFMVPALFLRMKVQLPEISVRAMDRVLIAIFVLTSAVLALDYSYGYRLGGFYEVQQMRAEIVRPRWLDYINGMLTGAALPFAFAYFAHRRRWVWAAVAALLPLAFFPVLLNKMVSFAPAWGVFLLVVFTWFQPKVAAALALTLPILAGLAVFIVLPPGYGTNTFYLVNLRMVGIPAIALDYYFDFFNSHPLTNFCQINVVRIFTGCPYADQLGVIMQNEYRLGNFNASLFASEGIASLGWLAPIGTLMCGIVVGLANATAVRLSPALVAVSSGVLVQTLMNVPLSTGLLTGGGALLFALWAIAPRGSTS